MLSWCPPARGPRECIPYGGASGSALGGRLVPTCGTSPGQHVALYFGI